MGADPCRVLVFGASGQLGIALQRANLPEQWAMQPLSRADVDLTDADAVEASILALRPAAIVNAAAYTAVDKAETERDMAFALNREAPAAMARAAAATGAAFVHISTDYVFRGDKAAPYTESDPIDPINMYGRSKAEGEAAVLDAQARAAIVRTSWVFSPFRSNFLRTMLRLGETQDEVSVVSDQIGRPTPADDLARCCIALVEKLVARDPQATGLFHFAGAEEATWADFAEAIFTAAASHGMRHVNVRHILTAAYPTPAQRPANSRLDTSKIERLGIVPAPWRDGMRAYVEALLARTGKPDP